MISPGSGCEISMLTASVVEIMATESAVLVQRKIVVASQARWKVDRDVMDNQNLIIVRNRYVGVSCALSSRQCCLICGDVPTGLL